MLACRLVREEIPCLQQSEKVKPELTITRYDSPSVQFCAKQSLRLFAGVKS
jgi:hypothetical protein